MAFSMRLVKAISRRAGSAFEGDFGVSLEDDLDVVFLGKRGEVGFDFFDDEGGINFLFLELTGVGEEEKVVDELVELGEGSFLILKEGGLCNCEGSGGGFERF